jgi:alpha-L-fucosidase 2
MNPRGVIQRDVWSVFIATAALFAAFTLRAQGALTLWYEAPAADWEREALPIGNGALGAMIYGGIAVERVQFNEKTLWTGGPGAKSGYDFGLPDSSMAAAVDDVAVLIEKQSDLDPKEVARRLGRKERGYGDYQSFGEMVLAFAPATAAVRNYRRELDLERAVARVRYEQDGVNYLREYFASYPDGVIVVRLSADRPGRISFHAKFAIPDNRTLTTTVQAGRIVASGALVDNGLKYEAAAQVLAEGGTRTELADGQVNVTGADAAVIILGAGTNYRQHYPDYRGIDPHEALRVRIDRAAAQGAKQLLARSVADYRALFDRVVLNIGPNIDQDIGQAPSALPTDRLLAQYAKGDAAVDRALEALYFQYGRYLLIAASRAGSLPANLQGAWNNSATPPWNADYHVNINLQMNYWLAESTNLAEAALPLFDFIDSLVEPGRRSAQLVADSPGWTLFLNTNIWGFTGVIDWPTAFWQPEAGAWLAQHYYEHYRYARDERFLRERAWPVMKGAAEFWLSALRKDPRDGSLVVSPSYSPEHGPFSAAAAMSQQIVFDLFTNVVEVAPQLGEAAFGQQVRTALAQLDSGLRVGSWGQLQEWKADRDDRKDDHRHASQLFALHPGRQISPQKTPQFAQAARVSLDARGDGGTGWSKAWKINFWARLLDGDRAHKLLTEQLRASTLPNLFDTHPPLQIDGNFGATAGMAEMLLQSQHGEIQVLPALPRAWPAGLIKGLRARGDVTVDIRWSSGAADEVRLRTGHEGPVALRTALFIQRYSLTDAASGSEIEVTGSGDLRTFMAKQGGRYVLRRKK